MGFRTIGKFFGATAFTLFLAGAIILMEIISFTSYSGFKNLAGGILEQQLLSQLNQRQIEELYAFLTAECVQKDKVKAPIEGLEVNLNCEDVKKADKNEITTLIIDATTDSLYYREYTCQFLDCVRQGGENLFVVVTNQGNQFYKSLQIYVWIVALVGLVIMLVSIETWTNRLKGVGTSLVVTALPFVFIRYFQSFLLPQMPAIAQVALPVINKLFTSVTNKFLVVLIIGIVVMTAGYALEFYLSRRYKKKK